MNELAGCVLSQRVGGTGWVGGLVGAKTICEKPAEICRESIENIFARSESQ